jgi:hypothetical protein
VHHSLCKLFWRIEIQIQLRQFCYYRRQHLICYLACSALMELPKTAELTRTSLDMSRDSILAPYFSANLDALSYVHRCGNLLSLM